ncbi:unnamed protein product (macronuclear) [Paramecium tetraurelia]|uniref:PB1 domain-containing protein n=1 Tax=Paramecium tetraurelia TaxID=5888 RepID=A0C8J1_PARTE|nr:uncharacterized protein GSPATT00036242001 [Paramecium tetraurelia]CAK67108.1 unnamed protein product [Paramecium tetraurelia]|eukprot:XP_001434505.1 hypothetical protein (macronuclear) [Paramecium tetraurelia strain d4-2]
MSNIKIVYQRKVHKLPPKVTTFQEIVETIKTLYPQIKEVHLFTIINPSRKLTYLLGEPDGIEEINCDLALTFLKKMYKQMKWPTIKLLVVENLNDETQLRNSMDLLNQSQIILDKSNYQDQPNNNKQVLEQNSKVPQKQVIDYKKDEKLKQAIVQIIDERLNHYNLLNAKDQETIIITQKAKKLSQMFTQYPENWLFDFVKQSGAHQSEEHLVSLLTEYN